MPEVTHLREAAAEVEVMGILSEKDLETVTVDGKESTRGTMVIQTDETNFVKIKVYANKLKKDGTENKVYPGILTVKNDFQSIAEVGREQATRVHVKNGKVAPQSYYDDSLTLRNEIHYQSNFFSKIKDGTAFESKAEFKLELYITSLVPETIKGGAESGEETGRLIVNGYLPTYNGIYPISLMVPKEIAAAVENEFEPGQTGMFFGEAVNTRIVETVEIPVVIGKPKKEEKITYRNELLVTGCTAPYGEEKAFPMEAIKKALAVREEELAEKKAKKESGSNTGARGNKAVQAARETGRSLPF